MNLLAYNTFPRPDATLDMELKELNNRKILSFQCRRFKAIKDPRITQIYQDALNSRANTFVRPNCTYNNHFGDCGNTRGYLTECRCPILNRQTNFEARRNYENDVINSVIKLAEHLTHIKLGVYCSGRLLGEEILLFRLLDRLQREGFKGEVELFFIDTEYQKAINSANLTHSLEESVGGAKYIEQFLEEMCMSLPKDISLKGSFFGSDHDYILAAETNQAFKHHLLIGADVMDLYKNMGPVGKRTGLYPSKNPIALVHAHDTPEVCLVDGQGELVDCKYVGPAVANYQQNNTYQPNPVNRTNSLDESKVKRMFPWILMTIVLAAVAFIAYKMLSKKIPTKNLIRL